jgi:hypothetical protein
MGIMYILAGVIVGIWLADHIPDKRATRAIKTFCSVAILGWYALLWLHS